MTAAWWWAVPALALALIAAWDARNLARWRRAHPHHHNDGKGIDR